MCLFNVTVLNLPVIMMEPNIKLIISASNGGNVF